MTPTKEQWAEIESQLGHYLGAVDLVCDGHKVQARVVRDKMKLVIAVYVDGVIKGEWIGNEAGSEIPVKFHREKKRYIGGAKYRAWLVKQSKSRIRTKEQREKYAADAKRTTSIWSPCWPNPAALCRHLRKTCTSIEIVKIGY